MKIKIMRKSGKPLELSELQKYDLEYKSTFDKLAARFSNVPEDTPHEAIIWGKVDMPGMQEALKAAVAEIQAKYIFIESVELPKSKKSWNALLRRFDGPILIANIVDNPDEAVLLVMDEE